MLIFSATVPDVQLHNCLLRNKATVKLKEFIFNFDNCHEAMKNIEFRQYSPPKIKLFRQREDMETCVCCCILMIQHAFHSLPDEALYPTRSMENKLYEMYGYTTKDMPEYKNLNRIWIAGTPLTAATLELTRNGLDVCYCYNPAFNYKRNIILPVPDEYKVIRKIQEQESNSYLFKLQQVNTSVVDCQLLKYYLDRGFIVIAAILADQGTYQETPHSVVIDKYNDTHIHLCDPAAGKYEVEESVFEKALLQEAVLIKKKQY